jgi:hypothetical protein
MDKVKVGAREYVLVAPSSFAMRAEIHRAMRTNPDRAMVAALGACTNITSKDPLKSLHIDYAACGYNALAYGGRLLDALVELGVPPAEIYSAGSDAWDFCVTTGSVPIVAEVVAAEDFTDPRPEGSTS